MGDERTLLGKFKRKTIDPLFSNRENGRTTPTQTANRENITKTSLFKYTENFTTNITKTYLYNVDPLKPHFNIVKLGFTGVYIIILISAQNINYGYSLEPPRRGGSNEYPQYMF